MPQPQKPGKNSDAVIKVKKEKFTVPYVTRRLRSATAEEGKQKFRAVLDRDIEEAMSECRETHENLSGCVSAKFLSMGNVMRQLGFQARKELETSISRDCSMMTGRCLEATASEVTCVEVIQPMEEKKSEGEEEAAKDKKPKKK
ncbi:MAG: hypothetical protein KDD70_16290 [Bdellovibrionales bacterium]|nr:hypothetical protein [Bdellovibrionales bacterium]